MDFKNHPVRGTFRVLGALLLFLLCYLLLGTEGAGWSVLPSLLCSLIFAVIFAKFSPKWGLICCTVFIAGAFYLTPIFVPYVAENGLNGKTIADMVSGTLEVIVLVIIIPVVIILALKKDRQIIRNRKAKNEEAGRPCCPYCGRTTIAFVQPHTEPIRREDEYGVWRVVDVKQIDGHWKCSSCKNIW